MVKSKVFTKEVLKALREMKVADLGEVLGSLASNEDLFIPFWTCEQWAIEDFKINEQEYQELRNRYSYKEDDDFDESVIYFLDPFVDQIKVENGTKESNEQRKVRLSTKEGIFSEIDRLAEEHPEREALKSWITTLSEKEKLSLAAIVLQWKDRDQVPILGFFKDGSYDLVGIYSDCKKTPVMTPDEFMEIMKDNRKLKAS